MSALQQFIAGLPKAELHLHIEGSFEPELMFDIATRNGSKLPYKSVAELRDAYRFQSLQDFLNLYYQGMSVLQTEGDFYDLTYAYCRRAHADNVRYTEIFFDPQGHTERGIAFELVLNGISAALDDAEGDFGLRSGLIICFLRHLPQASAQRALDQALVHKQRILGVGLDSSERDYPPENFASVFARAREEGFRLVAHAGEEGPAAYVRSSLDILRVERIDHGNRALDDADLVRHIVTRGIGLTVCPLSNLRLQVVQDLRAHPLREMLDLGIRASVNSDDPAYFGGYINANFEAIAQALDLSKDEIVRLAQNSFETAFISDTQRAIWLDELHQYAAANEL